jgi:hypothetical protein
MELAELLAQEGLEPEALMTWARAHADALVAGIAPHEEGGLLLRLLEPDGSIDVAAVKVAPVVVARPPIRVVEPVAEPEPAPAPIVEDASPPPLTVDELPPPPEQPRLAEGEPEPILETFDTGPIDLGTPEASALIARTSTIPPVAEPEPEPSDDEPELPVAVESAASEDELEEIELDELVELDDGELEVLDDLDEPESPLPKPPKRPVPVRTGDTASVPALEQPPVRTGDTDVHQVVAAADEDEPEDVDLDAPRAGDDDFDMDMDDD